MAALALGGIDHPRGVEPLVAILRDRSEDKPLRDHIAIPLQCMGTIALKPLITILRSRELADDAPLLAGVVTTLAYLGEAAIEGLADALQDEDVDVRTLAAACLVATGRPRAIEAVRSMPQEKDTTVSTDRATLLQLFDPPSLDRLLSAIVHHDGTVRAIAAIALGNTGDGNAVQSLTSAARSDPSEAVRDNALFSLSKMIDCPGVRDTLLSMLGEGNVIERMRAAVVLKVSEVPVLKHI